MLPAPTSAFYEFSVFRVPFVPRGARGTKKRFCVLGWGETGTLMTDKGVIWYMQVLCPVENSMEQGAEQGEGCRRLLCQMVWLGSKVWREEVPSAFEVLSADLVIKQKRDR